MNEQHNPVLSRDDEHEERVTGNSSVPAQSLPGYRQKEPGAD